MGVNAIVGVVNQEIANAIAALKAAADWPQEVKTLAFRDEAANVYLTIVPKKILSEKFSTVIPNLPHRLSMNRKVCYISDDVDTEEQQAQKTQMLRDLGVLGKIKIIPIRILATAIENGDKAALENLAELYDNYFVKKTCFVMEWVKVSPYFVAKNKIWLKFLEKKDVRRGLNKTGLFQSASNDSYTVKVGHAGLTDEQLQENVAHVVKFIKLQKVSALACGLPGLKLMQLKTGTTEGVPIYQADSVDEVIEEKQKPLVPAEVIADAIAKLKAAADWPKEPITPVFDSESDSVYLNILPKNMTAFEKKVYATFLLPHPLSMNRSLCYIGSNVDSEEEVSKATQNFRDQGIMGKIKIVPTGLVETVLKNNDQSALQELATLYDSYIIDEKCRFDRIMLLRPSLAEKKKINMIVKDIRKMSFFDSLMFINPSEDGFFVKVGDSGLTDQQLQENIAYAVKALTLKKIFLKSLDTIKLIQVKTGTTEGITIHQDDSVYKVVEPVISAEVIANGILALKAEAASWPKEAKFNDDASTVILNVMSNVVLEQKQFEKFKRFPLPHPLSLDRSVCYITQERLTEEYEAKVTQKLRDAGVLGKIKIIPKSLVELAVRNKDNEALAELAQIYDTHLLDFKLKSSTAVAVKRTLVKEYKLGFSAKGTSLGLDVSVIWLNVTKTGYFMKVGHSGLTDEQLQENITSAVNFIHNKNKGIFPDGLSSIKSLRLMTGTTGGVIIHQNKSAEEKVASLQEAPTGSENCNGNKQNGAAPRAASLPVKKNLKRKKTCPGITFVAASDAASLPASDAASLPAPKAASLPAPKAAPLPTKKGTGIKRKKALPGAVAKKLKAN